MQYGLIWPETSKKYGTKFDTNEECEVALFPIDNPEFVDELLSDIGLETLAERKRYMQRHEYLRVNIRKNG